MNLQKKRKKTQIGYFENIKTKAIKKIRVRHDKQPNMWICLPEIPHIVLAYLKVFLTFSYPSHCFCQLELYKMFRVKTVLIGK